MLAAIHRETPYRVISKPLESRIHFGTDEDAVAAPSAGPAAAVGESQPRQATTPAAP
jgi:hypothetical protein